MPITSFPVSRLVGCCFWCCVLCAAVVAQGPAAPPPPPAAGAAAAADDVKALVEQLGDVDFKVREAATEKLKAMGKAALPALKEAIESSGDPEVCSRADGIVRAIERPRVPADWLGTDGFGGRGVGPTSVRSSVVNGVSSTTVTDASGRRRVSILEGPAGIEMHVVGLENGQPVSARFRAENADDLREQYPDAYRVYQRWASNAAGRRLGRGQFALPQRGVPFRVMPAPIPLPPPQIVRPPADDLSELETAVRRHLREAKVPAEQRQIIEEMFGRMQQIQAEGRAIAGPDWDKQIERYNALSDALREKLKALKLPDPGDALPPPAAARLGVSVGSADPGVFGPGADAGLTVHRVVPNSRAERMGLKEGDVIQKVNGKAVADTGALRRAVTEAKGGLEIEVMRDGKPETVKDKPAE